MKSVAAICLFVFVTPVDAEITPTDVWHLAHNIDGSLQKLYDLDSSFSKNYLTHNAKPRNVYQRVVFLAREYNTVRPESIPTSDIDSAAERDANSIVPADVYGVLELMKKDLQSNGKFEEASVERKEKSPSDVYQMLRQISFHLSEVAQQQGMQAWAVQRGCTMPTAPRFYPC